MALVVKNPPANAGDMGLAFSRKSFIVSGLTFSSLIHFEFIFVYGVKVEKEMATHSGILAWKITWMEEPGGQYPVGSQRVGHN